MYQNKYQRVLQIIASYYKETFFILIEYTKFNTRSTKFYISIFKSRTRRDIICMDCDDFQASSRTSLNARHLIRLRLSRVSRALQPLTLRQFPLVTFKIQGGPHHTLLIVLVLLSSLALFTWVTERGKRGKTKKG